MNKIFTRALLVCTMAASMASCNDFLTIDPEDKPVLESYYTSPEALRSTTMTLYASKTWSNFHMNFQWKMDMINGDMYYTYGDEGQWYFGSYGLTAVYEPKYHWLVQIDGGVRASGTSARTPPSIRTSTKAGKVFTTLFCLPTP